MSPFKKYLKDIEDSFKTGQATEHTYRAALQNLIEALSDDIKAVNEPKHIACGAPDYLVYRSKKPVGYIEAKDINEPLERLETSEQLERYREGLSNLILTDYLEFRWYVAGELRMTARLATLTGTKFHSTKRDMENLNFLLQAFINTSTPIINNPKELAVRMGGMARLIRHTLSATLENEEEKGPLHQQMEGFRQVLLHDMTEGQFTDMYAQTICYGLFAARCNFMNGNTFTRIQAAHSIPKTNPFLRKMFSTITGPDLDNEPYAWVVDDLAEMLNLVDIEAILQGFGNRTGREDPVVHFYETFLAAYDPNIRQMRGVYYTPEPVVSYIVCSIDQILKKDFHMKKGLADTAKVRTQNIKGKQEWKHKVLILDPAAGTGTFLYQVIDHIYNEFKDNKGLWPGYVTQHLLPRIFGFELLMAPYAVAHMKLGLQLAQTGYDFASDERLRVYLTNTLEEAQTEAGMPLFGWWIAEEADAASMVKANLPLMVILGNPPYSGHSLNDGDWVRGLLRGFDSINNRETENYFQVDGNPLNERNPKWLNDDYVKFIRFAQWCIERVGYGVVAFVTNHGYLDNPTFRGMRQSLMNTFDDIYVLNLHGNSKKQEKAPDGSKDENVFDIQQGVAVGIFVKKPENKGKPARVYYADLWGEREVFGQVSNERLLTGGKYYWLWENDITTTHWQSLVPQTPFYLFIPQDEKLRDEYEQGWRITDIFPVNSVGIVTARDALTIHLDSESTWNTVNEFIQLSAEEARLKYNLRDDTRDWKVILAQEDIKTSGPQKDNVVPILYRPFDVRYTYYTGKSRGFHCMPRDKTMSELLPERQNLVLISARSNKSPTPDHFFCSRSIVEAKCGESTTQSSVFPLYLRNTNASDHLFVSDEEEQAPVINLSPEFVSKFTSLMNLDFIGIGQGDRETNMGAEDILFYMYAIFYSSGYRQRYATFFKTDYPRVPLTRNKQLFKQLCNLGGKLIALHLLDINVPLITKYPVPGDSIIEHIRYTPGKGREPGQISINQKQYFTGIDRVVWDYRIGGHQICENWLKARKGKRLSYDDLTHYQKIIAIIDQTIETTGEIDEVIEEYGGWPLDR